MPTASERIIRARELRATVGLSRSSVWRLERAGQFPKRIQLAPRTVGWRWSEIQAWLDSRKAA